MAKSGRHKKLRKQEKAKTQLKGRKILGKAQNVVEPKLRAKKVLIREQLKPTTPTVQGVQIDSDDETPSLDLSIEATTRKKQNIQEVLTLLNHHNKNVKKDALNGLLEIVNNQNAVLLANLDRILTKLGALTSDIERVVRKENIRVSEVIFAQIKEEQVRPFWNLLLAHVKCTLTNLNPTIRYECLEFLTLLISYFPNLTANSNHIILPNLLNLIATGSSTTQQQQPSAWSKPNKASSTKSKLKIEISDQHNDSRERLRVLSLIASCLDLETKKCYAESSSSRSPVEYEFGNFKVDSLYFGDGYLEYQRNGQPQRPAVSFNSNSLSGTKEEESTKFWPAFVQSCVPVLKEIRLEFKQTLKENAEVEQIFNLKLGPGLPSPLPEEISEAIKFTLKQLQVEIS